MANWRLAPTLSRLLAEVNAAFPLRDKTSDGTLGNASHAASKSDHNPDARRVVCAVDIDEDLGGRRGAYPHFQSGQAAKKALVDRLLALADAGRLPQLYYVIYERRIYSRTHGFDARPYSGVNAHEHHVHVSVYHTAALADRTAPWGIKPPPEPKPKPQPKPEEKPVPIPAPKPDYDKFPRPPYDPGETNPWLWDGLRSGDAANPYYTAETRLTQIAEQNALIIRLLKELKK